MDIYDSSLTRTIGTPLKEARTQLGSSNVGDYALFFGGITGINGSNKGSSVYCNSVDAYDNNLTLSNPLPLNKPRTRPASASLKKYTIICGSSTGQSIDYTMDTYTVSLTKVNLPDLGFSPFETAGAANDYAIFGGGSDTQSKSYLYQTHAYDESLVKFIPPILSKRRYRLAAACVNGYVLFAGGRDSNDAFDAVEAYDSSLVCTVITPLSAIEKLIKPKGVSIGNYAMIIGRYCIDIYNSTL